MSKAVRWQVPFVSLKGVQYRVDIYDTYTGTKPSTWPVQLQAGADPFVTEEDADDDIFTPVRGTTGTLTVIDTDGTLFEQIVPTSNTDRQVRLNAIENGSTSVVWTGFLGCEAYTQDYSGTAQELNITVISTLEAMKSVLLDTSAASYCTVRQTIAAVLIRIHDLFGVVAFSRIYFSTAAKAFLNTYLDTTIFFDEYEQDNEEKTYIALYNKSCMEILEVIAKFMGWTIREQGQYIFLQRIGEERGMTYMTYDNFIGSSSTMHAETMTNINMSALTWRGNAHTKSVTQGAKSVSVIASVEPYSMQFVIPECPYGSSTEQYVQLAANNSYVYLRTPNDQASNNQVSLLSRFLQMTNSVVTVSASGTTDMVIGNAWPSNTISDHTYTSSGTRSFTTFNKYIGSFFVFTELLDTTQYEDPESALYLSGIGRKYVEDAPYTLPTLSETTEIFKMATTRQFSASTGWLRVYAKGFAMTIVDGENNVTRRPFKAVAFTLYFTLKFGDKYWDGSAWVSSFAYFTRRFANGEIETNYSESVQTSTENNDGYFVPISSRMTGTIELGVHFVVEGGTIVGGEQVTPTEECALTDLEITYEDNYQVLVAERDTNTYHKQTGANFSDEVTIETEIASYLNNEPSPSIITDGGSVVKEITYTKSDGTTENRRPEHDLLDRMASYYGAARRKVEVEVEHPTQNSLPLLTITGYDGKTYAPLAEERDWKTDTSKLTLFETI